MAERRGKLRAVGPDDVPTVQVVKAVLEAAEGGEQRELLVAMRTRVAKAVQAADCPPRDLAALTRRLQDISREIEGIDARVRQEADEDGGITPDEEWDAEAI